MLIALTGAAGAGKDSAAAVLCAAGWHSIAFDDALRFEVAAAWGVDQRLLTHRPSKETPLPELCVARVHNAAWLRYVTMRDQPVPLLEPQSPRWVLQQWGGFRRAADPNYWVRHVAYWVQYQRQHGHEHLVVTDTRYPNEALTMRGFGGHIVRVHRHDAATLPPATAGHDSERHAQLVADADIHNDGSLAALGAEVWRVVEQFNAHQAPNGVPHA